jgi:group I intron endonuclease
MAYIYQIKNKVNDKVYIGSTTNYRNRFNQHKYFLRRNKHQNIHLQNAWNKYGEENFMFEVLEEVSEEEKFIKEQEYLDELNPFNENGYNINTCASGYFSGVEHPLCNFTEDDIVKIKKKICEGEILRIIADEFKAHEQVITAIKTLKRFSEIGKHLNEKMKYGKKIKREKLYNKTIVLYCKNFKIEDIANELKISRIQVKKFIKLHEARKEGKILFCEICGKETIKKSNNQKYCKNCAKAKQLELQKSSMKKLRNKK